ncbi:translation initiation factor IF-2 [Buchnera aphidicola (Astegopteryx bambusae)]|uniref:translation initiation factor IF-2 n=1 Tax=Buchnera aphidicola TaxID=9 RepID=UPI0031B81524
MKKKIFKNVRKNKKCNLSNKKISNKKKTNNFIKFKKYKNFSKIKNIKKNVNKISCKNKSVSDIKKNNVKNNSFVRKNFFNKFKKTSFIKKKNKNEKISNIKKNVKNKKFFIKNVLNNTVSSIEKKHFNNKKKLFKPNNINKFYKKRNIFKNKKITFIKQSFIKPDEVINKNIVLTKNTSIIKLSKLLGTKIKDIYKKLLILKLDIKNNVLTFNDAKLISQSLGYTVTQKKFLSMQDLFKESRNFHNLKMKSRPPVVTIMGHVDHGKTSILDCIRSTNIQKKELGGITQNITAYNVKINNKNITFLDTPGHEVFSNMRSRGAKITDLIVLVVAADDGIMPQTIEAIEHAKISKVPIIIAINKIDKVGNNIDFIKNELMKYKIVSEDLGGDNIFVLVSAKYNKGIKSLLDAIFLQTEMLELKAFYKCISKGVVIESFLDKNIGIISTVLVQEGTLKVGDFIICGFEYGKIKSIRDGFGNLLKCATPSIPVNILGLSGIPISGSEFVVIKDEKKAKDLINYKKNKNKQNKFFLEKEIEKEFFLENMKTKHFHGINLLVKAESQGSLEAICNKISNISNKDFVIKIISSSVGSINESDVSLAITSKSIILAFNVYPNVIAKKIILFNKLDIRYHSIIYNLLNEIKLLKKNFLQSNTKNILSGIARVTNIFKVSNVILVAGCKIIKGFVRRNYYVDIIRNKKIIFSSKISSIKHFKNDVKEVKEGLECGIIIKNFNKIKIKDILEVFKNK